MDYYLVSVFENQGHSAVVALCDQGLQKLSARNDLFAWAVAHHHNTLAASMLTRCDVHHSNCLAIDLAVRHNNARMLDVLLQPDHPSSLYSRFVRLLELSACDWPLLPTLANSFSRAAFEQMSERIVERIHVHEELARYESAGAAVEALKRAQAWRDQLHAVQRLRTPFKPKI